MRILWVCNVPMPIIAEDMQIKSSHTGGWLTGACNGLLENKNNMLGVVFPQNIQPRLITGNIDNIKYWGFPRKNNRYEIYDESLEGIFKEIVLEYQPDVVHIWGTEFAHSLAMVNSIEEKNKIVISIQGLCSIISKHYLAYLPADALRLTIRDFLKRDGLISQVKAFEKRGKNETKALAKVGHIIGRTSWDKKATEFLAPNAVYHYCGESLRNTFYAHSEEWNVKLCKRHSIFVSQANYPIKGFHLVLEAAYMLKQYYPDITIYTTGEDPRKISFYRVGAYQKWIVKLIENYNLDSNIFYLGSLDEEKMYKQYINANVFVSASSIENSSNSIGEAMMLGVPIVASYVGGTMDILEDRKEGLLYAPDEPHMMAACIRTIFDNDEFACELGKNASKHALRTHDRKTNNDCLLNIYTTIGEGKR